MTTDVVVTHDAGPRWQRVVLVALAVWGLVVVLVVPAGQFVPSLVTLVLAVVVAGVAVGNRRWKVATLVWLGALCALSVVSLAWA